MSGNTARPSLRWRIAVGLSRIGAFLVLVGIAECGARLVWGPPEPSLNVVLEKRDHYFDVEGQGVRTNYQGEFALHSFSMQPSSRPRVAWLGGSSIRGASLPELEAPHLVERSTRTENLNLAAPGLDTRHFLEMLPEVLSFSPDVLVIYTGHNDRGNAVFSTLYQTAGRQFLARVFSWLGKSRLYSLMRSGSRGLVERLPVTPTMDLSHAPSQEALTGIRAEFEERLRQIVRQAHSQGVQVVLVTVVSNPLAHPFAYQCPDALKALGLSISHESHGALDIADLDTEELARLRVENPDCRELQVFQARLDKVAGEAHAIETLDRLRDAYPLPVSADRATVGTIRRVALEEGVVLADANAAFRIAGGGIEPPGWFWDPNHLREAGQQALASVVAESLRSTLQLQGQGLEMPPLPDLTLDGRPGGLGPQPPPDDLPPMP